MINDSKDFSEKQLIIQKNQISECTKIKNNRINIIKKKDSNIEKIGSRNSIRLLTYNIFCRPPPINTNADDYKDLRLKDFIEELHNFDIICFQELFTTLNDRKHKMIQEGAKVGLKYYLASKVPSFFSKYLIDSGLLILSRFEIVENDTYEYYINVSGDAPSNKGILYAKIKVNGKYLFLFNTHLQSSYLEQSQKSIDYTIKVRTKQTEELINFVYNKLLTIPRDEIKNGCVLIVGDFNIDAHDNEFAKKKNYKIPKYKNTEYEIFKLKLSKLGTAIDLMEKKYKNHIFTFGNNEKEEYDHTLISKAEMNIKQTLDYIWEIIPDYNLDIYNGYNQYNKSHSTDDRQFEKAKIKILYDTLKVQEFLVKDKPYQQLSDHFGVSVDLLSPSNNQNLIDPYVDKIEIEKGPLKDN